MVLLFIQNQAITVNYFNSSLELRINRTESIINHPLDVVLEVVADITKRKDYDPKIDFVRK